MTDMSSEDFKTGRKQIWKFAFIPKSPLNNVCHILRFMAVSNLLLFYFCDESLFFDSVTKLVFAHNRKYLFGSCVKYKFLKY